MNVVITTWHLKLDLFFDMAKIGCREINVIISTFKIFCLKRNKKKHHTTFCSEYRTKGSRRKLPPCFIKCDLIRLPLKGYFDKFVQNVAHICRT